MVDDRHERVLANPRFCFDRVFRDVDIVLDDLRGHARVVANGRSHALRDHAHLALDRFLDLDPDVDRLRGAPLHPLDDGSRIVCEVARQTDTACVDGRPLTTSNQVSKAIETVQSSITHAIDTGAQRGLHLVTRMLEGKTGQRAGKGKGVVCGVAVRFDARPKSLYPRSHTVAKPRDRRGTALYCHQATAH
jgi:hypothetical protein